MSDSNQIECEGFAIVPQVLDEKACEKLRCLLGDANGAGTRGMLCAPEVMRLSHSVFADLVRPHLPAEPIPVRGLYFDKRPGKNWLVAWHQDLTLALKEQAELPGWGPWSVKDGVPHVQPPVDLLKQMLTVRLHLDDADESNGALRVVSGSHRFGRLNAESTAKCRKTHPEVLCAAKAGDALLMRPLLLHASSRSTNERSRRVLHIEFAGFSLPPPLAWRETASFSGPLYADAAVG